MRFATELTPHELPAAMRLMTGIVDWRSWKQRSDNLESFSRNNPYWENFVFDRHGRELAFGNIHRHLRLRGKCPWPPRSADEYRLYSFLSVAVRVHRRLSAGGRRRFSGAVRSALEREFGLGPLAFEMKIVAHLMGRGYQVEFHDFESGGGFDFLVSRGGSSIELECKHISADVGRQIHRRKLYELGGRLWPAISNAMGRSIGGLLVQITLPGRLTNNHADQNKIAERVFAVLSGDTSKIDDSVCQVSTHPFSLDSSPFSINRGHNLKFGEIETFLREKFGIQNANILHNWRPGHAAIIVHIHSKVPDKVLGEVLKHLKEDAKK